MGTVETEREVEVENFGFEEYLSSKYPKNIPKHTSARKGRVKIKK